MTPSHASAITRSLELAGERCADLAPGVYSKLFEKRPELSSLFRQDARIVQGEMLALAIEGILDFIGPRLYSHFWFANEGVRHEANIDRATFMLFFEIMAETVQETAGADWTGEMQAAWRALVGDLEFYVQDGNM